MLQTILCLAVEPRIGGVLLCGEKGTAKSTLVRAMGGLEGVDLVELPVSTTEDMLLGGVELETAVRTGRRQFQPGLLARADGAVLYADEINLLPAAPCWTPWRAGCAGWSGTAFPIPVPPDFLW